MYGRVTKLIVVDMINPSSIIDALFETFDKSARADFRKFLETNAGVTKWMISSDYCLHDSSKSNDVFAFTVIPYDDHWDSLREEINTALPKDLKATKVISDAAEEFLSDPRRFHFAFILKSKLKVFTSADETKPIHIARKSIDETIDVMVQAGRSDETVRIMRTLQRAAASHSFNLKLLSNIFLLSYLYPFITLLLAREQPAAVIGWMSDRDKMTQAYDGVLWVIANENVRGLAESLGVALPHHCPVIAIPTPADDASAERPLEVSPDSGNGIISAKIEVMWFDEFIRIPDYIAGVLSSWDFSKNTLPSEQRKYLHLLEDVIASATNMAVITVRYNEIFQTGRLVFGEAAPCPIPHATSKGIISDPTHD